MRGAVTFVFIRLIARRAEDRVMLGRGQHVKDLAARKHVIPNCRPAEIDVEILREVSLPYKQEQKNDVFLVTSVPILHLFHFPAWIHFRNVREAI